MKEKNPKHSTSEWGRGVLVLVLVVCLPPGLILFRDVLPLDMAIKSALVDIFP